jgi:hypothetical protein
MTSIYPLGQPEEEFGSEQRVLHLATVSKKGAVHSSNATKCDTKSKYLRFVATLDAARQSSLNRAEKAR